MTYNVVWVPHAERKLTSIWLQSPRRGMITLAANELDRSLRFHPDQVGESRDGNRRIAFETPLAIEFEVIEADRLVRVLVVWEFSATL